ncbi:glycosyltransferase [Parasedimentitalea marina]|uniref:glycosyltransferase n=1 Tax=Parasedimentitalea marina TaxID=2483033 RepID=UPI0013E2D6AE|nr:glycosyltransferase [Parasedimentitalea marina]
MFIRPAAAFRWSRSPSGGTCPYTLTKSEKNGIANYLIHIDQNRSYAELYDNPQITALFGQLIDQLQPDVLHAHCLQDIGAGVLQTAKARGLPVVLSVHDFWWICDRQFMIRVNQRYCGQDPVRIENCRSCAENFSAARTRFDIWRPRPPMPMSLHTPASSP